MDSLADLEAQRNKVTKEITVTIDSIDEINTKLEDLNNEINSDKTKIKNLNAQLHKNS